MRVHFHLIDPDEAALALFAELAAAFPGLALGISRPKPPGHSGAAPIARRGRFLVGPALLATRYGSRLVLTDIDVDFVAPLDDLLAATAGYAFAGFRHDGAKARVRAIRRCWTVWDRMPAGTALLDQVDRFVLSKLDIEWPFNWMLDQAALDTGAALGAGVRPDMASAIINELARPALPATWLRSVGGEEKAELIRAARQAQP